jgi:selenide,water dikinase
MAARQSQTAGLADLVLVGGGHAHVQVLRRFMMKPPRGLRVSVVLDRPVAVYSGMVPGLVAGDYVPEELEIDVVPLARRARARVILSAATRIDPHTRRIELDGRPPLFYDIASLDVGSTVRGLELAGVSDHALTTRPIGGFVSALPRRLAAARPAQGPTRVAVVGGGVAGIELAFTLQARMRGEGLDVALALFCSDREVLPGTAPRVAALVRAELTRRGIAVHLGAEVSRVEKDAVYVRDMRTPADLVVWASGAAAPSVVRDSSLPHDEAGFVRTRSTLQVEGHDDLFAAGDCAALIDHPWVPKAGVYAVRQGPILDANLRAHGEGRSLRSYRPQRDFLSLINLGGARALGTKWGLAFSGGAVWRAKDAIDRRFMRRFQVLDAAGGLAVDFPTPESMGMEEMACGGCAAKVAASPLERALRRLPPAAEDDSVLLGLGDDAAAVSLPRGDIVLATVDGFRAFTDDPWLVGRVAAVNAVSDVLAKGGQARHALALVNVPEDDARRAEESLFQVLAGVRAALDPLGVTLIGGHTTHGEELFVGLTVTGTLPADATWLPIDGARPGDLVVLTKAVGTGIVLAADMQGRARGVWVAGVHASMQRHNVDAARIAREQGVHACTDVSGFGLAGHLLELARASGVSARIDLERLPALPGALALLERGTRSSYHEQNATLRSAMDVQPAFAGAASLDLLFDPQTSGGLLLAAPPERVDALLAALCAAGDGSSAVIGRIERERDDRVRIHVARLEEDFS